MIQRVKLYNWRSHAETEFEFSRGTNALFGIMGSGKSSVLQAIVFALYGDLPELREKKMKLDDLIMFKPQQKNAAAVELTFGVQGKWWQVKREIKLGIGSNADLRCDGKLVETGSSKVTDYITSLLSVDFDLFSRAVYAKQNEIDYFLTLPKGKRMEKIDELLRINRLEESRQLLNEAQNTTKSKIQTLDGVVQQSSLEELEKNYSQAKLSLTSLEDQLGNLVKGRSELEKARVDIDARLKEMEKTKSELEILERELFAFEKKKIELSEKVKKLATYSLPDPKERFEELKKQKLEAQQSSRAQSQLKGEQDSLTSRCVLLEKKLKDMVELGPTETILKKQNQLKQLSGKVKAEIDAINSSLSSSVAPRVGAEADRYRHELNEVTSHLEKLTSALADVDKKSMELDSAITTVESAFRELGRHESIKINVQSAQVDAKKADCALRGTIDEYASVGPLKAQIKELSSKHQELKGLLTEKEREFELQSKSDFELKSKLTELRRDGDRVQDQLIETVKLLETVKQLDTTRDELTSAHGRVKEIDQQLSRLKVVDVSSIDEELERVRLAIELEQAKADFGVCTDGWGLVQSKIAKLNWDKDAYLQITSRKEEVISRLSSSRSKESGMRELMEEKSRSLVQLEQSLARAKTNQVSLKKLRSLLSKLQVLEHALKDAQELVRKEFMNTVNMSMGSVWEILYPYEDFPQIRMAVTSDGSKKGDYVLELQDRMGKWLSVDLVSGGERSMACLALRIAFARVLVPTFKLLILDEPTHNLDARGVEELANALRDRVSDLVEQALIITHEEKLEKAVTGTCYRLHREKHKDEVTKVVAM